MSSLAIVTMIGYFLVFYLVTALIVLAIFFTYEWNRMGQPDDLDFYDFMQIAASLMEKHFVFSFLLPFIWFSGLWMRDDDDDED